MLAQMVRHRFFMRRPAPDWHCNCSTSKSLRYDQDKEPMEPDQVRVPRRSQQNGDWLPALDVRTAGVPTQPVFGVYLAWTPATRTVGRQSHSKRRQPFAAIVPGQE